MARHKDGNWNLPGPKLETYEQVQIAVLMDIRDELKQLNRVFACSNFQQMPWVLRTLRDCMNRIDKRMLANGMFTKKRKSK